MMKAGKITAKIRDAVKVYLMVDGKEVMMYKNIDLPDSIKDLDIKDFGFNTHTEGKIDFHLMFDQGILPEVFPQSRPTNHRKPKDGKVAATANAATATPESKQTPTLSIVPAVEPVTVPTEKSDAPAPANPSEAMVDKPVAPTVSTPCAIAAAKTATPTAAKPATIAPTKPTAPPTPKPTPKEADKPKLQPQIKK